MDIQSLKSSSKWSGESGSILRKSKDIAGMPNVKTSRSVEWSSINSPSLKSSQMSHNKIVSIAYQQKVNWVKEYKRK